MIPQKRPEPLAPDDKRITRKEARDLLHALDRPEFSGLMDGYINEISDPNNIKETNQFLKESEEKKDLPSNVKLAKPKPGFCIKSVKYKIKTPSNRQKVFINICSYPDVPEPKSNENNMWSLPHLLNKGRHDQDKKKKICTTFDVVFNEKAIKLSNENKAFKKFVCDTAINGINDQLLSSEGEKISSDFVVKKFNYKGLEVSYINIHSLTKGEMDDRKEPTEYHKTQIQKEVEKMKKENEEKKNNNNDNDDIDVYNQPDIDDTDKVNDVIKQQKLIDKDSKIPIYKIKYSDNFELKNYFYQPDGINDNKPEYTKIIISINTPLMNSVGDANLEVDVKELKFSYKDIYELNLKLPVEVKKESVTAKYDKSKKILNVTCEIVRKELPKIPIKEDENIEIVKEDEEEEKEREKKKKEEEEKIKKENEEKLKKENEEKLKREEEIKKEKEEQEKKIQEIEEKLKREKEEKEKREKEEKEKKEKEEIIIKGKKEEINKNLPLKEVKFKNEEEEEKKEENKKLIEEIPQTKDDEITTDSRLLKKNNQKDEDDQPNNNNINNNNNSNNNNNNNNNEENKTPIIFLNFSSDWVYDLQ